MFKPNEHEYFTRFPNFDTKGLEYILPSQGTVLGLKKSCFIFRESPKELARIILTQNNTLRIFDPE